MLNDEREFHIVTGSDAKVQAWAQILGPKTTKVNARFSEPLIQLFAPESPIERIVHIVTAKNRMDRENRGGYSRSAFDSALLHSALSEISSHNLMPDIDLDDILGFPRNITRVCVDTVMGKFPRATKFPPEAGDDKRAKAIERPKSIKAWYNDERLGAMGQAGARIELDAGIHVEDERTGQSTYLILRSLMRGANYTRGQVDDWMASVDPEVILKTAGGFPFFSGAREWLYDQRQPIEVFLQGSLKERPVHVETIPWNELTDEKAMQLVYGTVPAVIAEASARLPDVFLPPSGTIYEQ